MTTLLLTGVGAVGEAEPQHPYARSASANRIRGRMPLSAAQPVPAPAGREQAAARRSGRISGSSRRRSWFAPRTIVRDPNERASRPAFPWGLSEGHARGRVGAAGGVYCRQPADSREDWFPRWLGRYRGVDLLLERLCDECNGELGRKLDQSMSRESAEAVNRYVLQQARSTNGQSFRHHLRADPNDAARPARWIEDAYPIGSGPRATQLAGRARDRCGPCADIYSLNSFQNEFLLG